MSAIKGHWQKNAGSHHTYPSIGCGLFVLKAYTDPCKKCKHQQYEVYHGGVYLLLCFCGLKEMRES